MITATIKLQGMPLRRVYVSHFDFGRLPQTLYFRTDENGQVTISNQGVMIGDDNGPDGEIEVQVYAQNPVLRILDVRRGLAYEVFQKFTIRDGEVVDIDTEQEQQDHFCIIDTCLDVYERVFRGFPPYSHAERGEYPFRLRKSLAATRDSTPRIELRYPENDVYAPQLAWTEPVGIPSTLPTMHIKDKSRDSRLFGDAATLPSLLAHELAHAMQFGLLPFATRAGIETRYAGWLISKVTSGQPAFHNTAIKTDPFIAFLESFGLFSERLYVYARFVRPDLVGAALHLAFVQDELSAKPSLGSFPAGKPRLDHEPVGGLTPSGDVKPRLTGADIEGAVYGAFFLDFARRRSLREVVDLFLRSRAQDVDDFLRFVRQKTRFDAEISAVARTWKLE